jgi:dolichyl-phosphate beta-glucosyltransferase
MRSPAETWIVVPCYNEALRFDGAEFRRFASEQPNIHFLFVDDGSTDATLPALRALEDEDGIQFQVLAQPENRGKAEAVRAGMNHVFSLGAVYAGYWDADLATPLDEIPAFIDILNEHPGLEILLGSRVQLLGRSIERRAIRHYFGRVSATAISVTLDLAVYDTQCGAKLFRTSSECKALFAAPFVSTWVFDVELIARLINARRATGSPAAAEVIQEAPLWEWRDIEGSKVQPVDFFRSLLVLRQIRNRYLKRR